VATKTGWDFTDAQKKEIQINKSAEVKQEEEYGESGGRGRERGTRNPSSWKKRMYIVVL
jgi:hypothetical protein